MPRLHAWPVQAPYRKRSSNRAFHSLAATSAAESVRSVERDPHQLSVGRCTRSFPAGDYGLDRRQCRHKGGPSPIRTLSNGTLVLVRLNRYSQYAIASTHDVGGPTLRTVRRSAVDAYRLRIRSPDGRKPLRCWRWPPLGCGDHAELVRLDMLPPVPWLRWHRGQAASAVRHSSRTHARGSRDGAV